MRNAVVTRHFYQNPGRLNRTDIIFNSVKKEFDASRSKRTPAATLTARKGKAPASTTPPSPLQMQEALGYSLPRSGLDIAASYRQTANSLAEFSHLQIPQAPPQFAQQPPNAWTPFTDSYAPASLPVRNAIRSPRFAPYSSSGPATYYTRASSSHAPTENVLQAPEQSQYSYSQYNPYLYEDNN
jgi:hypothetical protein